MRGRKGTLTPAEGYVAGFLTCILSGEGIHLLLIRGRSLSWAGPVWAVVTMGLLILGLLVPGLMGKLRRSPAGKESLRFGFLQKGPGAIRLIWMGLALFQLCLILSGSGLLPWNLPGAGIYREGDMTLETVKTFLVTDGVYRVNPLTGADFQAGMPMRLKLLGLPTLYALICSLTGWEAEYVVRGLVPCLVWLATYTAYASLGDTLFENRKEKDMFLLAVSILLLGGSYARGMDGFGFLYGAWRGESIRSLVVIPFFISCLLGRKWLPAAACILCEACLVWTLYGAGWTMALGGIMGALWLLKERAWPGRLPGGFPSEKGEGL